MKLRESRVERGLILYGKVYLVWTSFICTYTYFVALSNPNFQTIVDVNHYGEAIWELFLVIPGILGLYTWALKWLRDKATPDP